MELKASSKFILHSPRKMRRTADLVRGKDLAEAMDILRYLPNRASYYIAKVLRSAAANNFNFSGDDQLDENRLFVKVIYVNEGPRYKRIMYRAYGRATRVLKRTCHIHVVLDERAEEELSRHARRKMEEKPKKGKAKEKKRTMTPMATKEVRTKKKEEKAGEKAKEKEKAKKRAKKPKTTKKAVKKETKKGTKPTAHKKSADKEKEPAKPKKK